MHRSFDLNIIGNDYVVGDIHGCFSLLEQKLKELNFNKETDRLFCVGDLIDRGEENKRVLEFLKYSWFHSITGNHEDMIIQYFYLPQNDKKYSMNAMIQNGAEWFLNLKLEEQKEFVDEFQKLFIMFDVIINDNKKVGIVHADCYHDDWNLNVRELLEPITFNKIYDNSIWNRKRITFKDETYIKNIDYVVHGHTPLQHVGILGNRFYIDTGACYNNNLTVLKLNDLITIHSKHVNKIFIDI